MKIIKAIKLVFEGRNIFDSTKIVFWFFGIMPSLYLNNSDGIFFVRKNSADLWMLSPMGEGEIRKFFNLKRGVFLDIGANVGKYSILMGKQLGSFGRVIAFEPEPKNLVAFRKNIYLNKVKNIQVIEQACSDIKGEINLYLDDTNTGGHSITEKKSKKITVSTNTLDNFLEENSINQVDLIKIDVEGAEEKVLLGAEKTLRRFRPKIIFECWDNVHYKKIFAILNKKKYSIKKISKIDYIALPNEK